MYETDYVIEPVKAGDYRASLVAIAKKLARRFDQTSDARSSAALCKQLRETLAEIKALDEEEKKASGKVEVQEKVSPLHVIQNRKADRIPRANDRLRAKVS
jgi:hypothetical protein